MDIAVCTDRNYVMPCGVMLYSICQNNKDSEITFHIIIDESVNQRAQKSLENTIFPKSTKKACFYVINGNDYNHLPRLDETNPKDYITQAAYYRLNLSKILPDCIDKLLYLDSDIIVRHSLEDLWNTDLDNYSIGVVPDVGEGVIDKYNRLRYPPHNGYFNSGVLLINLKKWRDEQIYVKFDKFIQEKSDWIKLHDQDVLNRIFYDDKLILPIKYNFQEGFLWNDIFYDYWKYEKQVLAARKDPVIIHYTDSKPWIENCDHPMKDVFFKYRKETEWANTPIITKEKESIFTRIIKPFIRKLFEKIGIITPHPICPSKYI